MSPCIGRFERKGLVSCLRLWRPTAWHSERKRSFILTWTMGLHHQPEKTDQLANKANNPTIGDRQRSDEKIFLIKKNQDRNKSKSRGKHSLSLVDVSSLNFTIRAEDLGNFSSSMTWVQGPPAATMLRSDLAPWHLRMAANMATTSAAKVVLKCCAACALFNLFTFDHFVDVC